MASSNLRPIELFQTKVSLFLQLIVIKEVMKYVRASIFIHFFQDLPQFQRPSGLCCRICFGIILSPIRS
jgi:hypothetical protein